jgi:hypothetical protein
LTSDSAFECRAPLEPAGSSAAPSAPGLMPTHQGAGRPLRQRWQGCRRRKGHRVRVATLLLRRRPGALHPASQGGALLACGQLQARGAGAGQAGGGQGGCCGGRLGRCPHPRGGGGRVAAGCCLLAAACGAPGAAAAPAAAGRLIQPLGGWRRMAGRVRLADGAHPQGGAALHAHDVLA